MAAQFVIQQQAMAIPAAEVFTFVLGVSLELKGVLSLMNSSQRLLQRSLNSIRHFRLSLLTLASFSLSFYFGTPNYHRFVVKGPHHKNQLHFHFVGQLIHLVSEPDADFFFDLGLELMDPLNRLLEHVAAPRSDAHADYELQYLGLEGSHHYDFYD